MAINVVIKAENNTEREKYTTLVIALVGIKVKQANKEEICELATNVLNVCHQSVLSILVFVTIHQPKNTQI